jgi:putative tryptophan/tyrosine transport system substrate-binding protein
MSGMRRREFITYLGGAAAWPAVAMGEQSDRLRRVGVLMGFGENDSEGILWLSSFIRAFRELGWTDGRNVRLEIRWGASDLNRQRMYARELVRLQPDVILAHGTSPTAAVQRETSTIPIVFAAVSDPVGEGFVESLPRPGANITGFIFTEAGMGGKWLELLKEIAPTVKRAAMIFNPDTAPGHGSYYLSSFKTAARSLNVEAITAPISSDAEIETAITSLGREADGGLVVSGDTFLVAHRETIIFAAAQNKVPAIYFHAVFAREGGLFAYGPDNMDLFRRAASYVDRVLRGANPRELPVQVPIKFEQAINLRTAKTLGLTVPLTLQASADEVIE